MISNDFLKLLADAMYSGEIQTPEAMAYGNTVVVPAPSDASLTGEFGDRTLLLDDNKEATNTMNKSTIRPGSTIVGSESIKSIAIQTKTTDGDANDIMVSSHSIPEVLQTNAFDIDVSVTYTFNRQ